LLRMRSRSPMKSRPSPAGMPRCRASNTPGEQPLATRKRLEPNDSLCAGTSTSGLAGASTCTTGSWRARATPTQTQR
jgi:hypothetical protein